MRTLSKALNESLEERYGPLWPWPDDYFSDDPFKNLVLTILSQNTNEANCLRAYKGLREKLEITPLNILKASEKEIKEAIKPGGLYNLKAKRLRQVAGFVLHEFDGDLGAVLALPKKKAKKELMRLPKTADVILTTKHSYKKVIPVNTHMDRLAKRLGLVRKSAKYEETQKALKKFIPAKCRERSAGLLWLLAKHTCKPGKPKCGECILNRLCEHSNKQG
jgi:endonuclease III